MSEGEQTMSPLAVLQMVNAGVLVYEQVAPLVIGALERGEDVNVADLEAKSGILAANLRALADAIAKAKVEGR